MKTIGNAAIAAAIAAVAALSPAPARADDTVTIGVVGAVSDVTLYLAEKKGYLHDEGLKGDITVFDSGAKMVAPLGAGQLDVGAGAWSAGFFNALQRGIDIRIVADKATNKAPYDYRVVIVRQPLVGQIKTLADLKGRKIGITAVGAGDNASIAVAMKSVGLGLNDVDRVYMGFSAQLVALANGGIDAAFSAEPDATIAARERVAQKFAPYSSFYPVQETGVILFGSNFLHHDRAKAEKFMRAYLRAVRFYDGSLKDGHIVGPGAQFIYETLAGITKQSDKTIFRDMTASWANPNGTIDIASLRTDFASFKAEGEVQGNIKPEDAVDQSFVAAAVKKLGPYKGPAD
jgi:NitT/TauT family transport system substrate-binding protein